VVLLHGFGGTRHAWDGVSERLDRERYLPLALDVPGHGDAAEEPGALTFAGCVRGVLESSPPTFTLGGYSLGGRVALHVALAAPERLERLVLVACSPGIEDPAERGARRAADAALAEELEQGSYEEFIERWRAQPLFAEDPPAVGELARADQRRNRPERLAAVLRGLGTGEMQPLWARLGEIELPTTVVVGERDAKFQALGERMVALLPCAELRIVAGGHALALENPAAVARALEGRGGIPTKGRPRGPGARAA
jgi:2-succinyl-6-hydroxy-2,4-cyclohexadiene-1-carboxylate synthase